MSYRTLQRLVLAAVGLAAAVAVFPRVTSAQPADLVAIVTASQKARDNGDFAAAEREARRFEQAVRSRFGVDHQYYGRALHNLALAIYYGGAYNGRAAEAEPLFKRTLAIFEKTLGRDHADVANALDGLSAVYNLQGRHAESIPLATRALAILEKINGPDHRALVNPLDGLALVYTVQAQYAEAERLSRRALAIQQKAFGPEHRNIGHRLTRLASIYARQGRLADAVDHYKQALTLLEKVLGPEHPELLDALNGLSYVYMTVGQDGLGLPLVRRFIASGQAMPEAVLPRLRSAYRRGRVPAEDVMNAALDVVQRSSQTSAASAVRSFALRLAAGNDRLAQLIRKDQDLTAEAEALDKDILAAASREPAQRNAAAEQRIRARAGAVASERRTVQDVLAREFPNYAALSRPASLTVKQIQAVLSADDALVALIPGQQEGHVFVVTREKSDWVTFPVGNDKMARRVASFRKGLDVNLVPQSGDIRGKTELFDLGDAHDLYTTLFSKVADAITDRRNLIVVPSGALTALPFNLLVTDWPERRLPDKLDDYREAAWLMKRHAVTVLPSVGSLKSLRAVAGQGGSKTMIGFGDPLFNPGGAGDGMRMVKASTRNLATGEFANFWKGAAIDRAKLAQSLPQLPDTADELKAIAKSLNVPEQDIHLGRNASETAVKQAPLSDYRVVYFATHGLVAGDVKGLAEPSLALSIPSQPTSLDDGLLTASEIAQLRLNADWVVLSACNTIAGNKPGAEALSGLARAFFYAGARSLLVSHWAVDSEAATRLTTKTFALLRGDPALGQAEALRQATIDYLNDKASPLNAYPAFWGPFALIGEGGSGAR
jgi:CHAT domain-containing protein